jgi:formamidopyrimidine-DNA glycosylase
MPEGPEVCVLAQYLDKKLRAKKITGVRILGGKYIDKPFDGYEMIAGKVLAIDRVVSKGKFMWFETHDQHHTYWIGSGLGMTGRWVVSSDQIDARICFDLKSKKGNCLYYVDPRNHGNVSFISDPQVLEIKLNSLAPCIVTGGQTTDQLCGLIREYMGKARRYKNIVIALMDQRAIVSGIGNYMVSEILYMARLDPHRDIRGLDDQQIRALAIATRQIAKSAYYNNTTSYTQHMQGFATNHAKYVDTGALPCYHPDIVPAKQFEFHVYGRATDANGNPVIKEQIAKPRRIHWVPAVQI